MPKRGRPVVVNGRTYHRTVPPSEQDDVRTVTRRLTPRANTDFDVTAVNFTEEELRHFSFVYPRLYQVPDTNRGRLEQWIALHEDEVRSWDLGGFLTTREQDQQRGYEPRQPGIPPAAAPAAPQQPARQPAAGEGDGEHNEVSDDDRDEVSDDKLDKSQADNEPPSEVGENVVDIVATPAVPDIPPPAVPAVAPQIAPAQQQPQLHREHLAAQPSQRFAADDQGLIRQLDHDLRAIEALMRPLAPWLRITDDFNAHLESALRVKRALAQRLGVEERSPLGEPNLPDDAQPSKKASREAAVEEAAEREQEQEQQEAPPQRLTSSQLQTIAHRAYVLGIERGYFRDDDFSPAPEHRQDVPSPVLEHRPAAAAPREQTAESTSDSAAGTVGNDNDNDNDNRALASASHVATSIPAYPGPATRYPASIITHTDNYTTGYEASGSERRTPAALEPPSSNPVPLDRLGRAVRPAPAATAAAAAPPPAPPSTTRIRLVRGGGAGDRDAAGGAATATTSTANTVAAGQGGRGSARIRVRGSGGGSGGAVGATAARPAESGDEDDEEA
ncbi:6397b34d-4f29-41a2-a180-103d78c3d33c [Thermothielavioides terrestris]|uniref:6397b34d-4f29-41a2-a180-103d78c3d33c n=1 Tax=Thermothielavioides terrestris TaxID=2587410 RepID=A0A3S4EUB3_9PEZI|nr:6397b34d-4f29-41a2-a180-103d78c3d33c [Thermothielavioides terrestris]